MGKLYTVDERFFENINELKSLCSFLIELIRGKESIGIFTNYRDVLLSLEELVNEKIYKSINEAKIIFPEHLRMLINLHEISSSQTEQYSCSFLTGYEYSGTAFRVIINPYFNINLLKSIESTELLEL